MCADGSDSLGIANAAADDGAALHFRGPTLVEAISSKPEASAYRVELDAAGVTETRLPIRFLGNT
jgi:dipeptidase E